MVKAVLFDLDGVLIDSYNAWLPAFNDIREQYGKPPISEGDYRRFVWSQPSEEIVARFFPGEDLGKIRGLMSENFSKYIGKARLLEGADKVPAQLKELGFKLAIVSNSPNAMVKEILGHFGILEYFDEVLGGDDVKSSKPSPEMVLTACGKLRVGVEDAVLVGDNEVDVQAGRNAGIKSIGVGVQGDYRVEGLDEIPEILSKGI